MNVDPVTYRRRLNHVFCCGLVAGVFLGITSCGLFTVCMRAFFEADLARLRGEQVVERTVPPRYRSGTKLAWYDGSGYWGNHLGVVINVSEDEVVVDWYQVSGEAQKPMGLTRYTRIDFEAQLDRTDGWNFEIVD